MLTKRTKKTKKAAATIELENRPGGRLPLPPMRGPLMPSAMRPRLAEPAPSTTRQTSILNTAVLAAPTSNQGVLIGRDRLAGALVAHDPFTAYGAGDITSPNVVVLGVIGSGKSSLNKTVYCLRPLIFKDRRVVVIDRKMKDDRGEYTGIVETFGGLHILMTLDGTGMRLNLMDPRILQGAGPEAQFRLLKAMAEIAGGEDRLLDPWEAKALRMARALTLNAAESDLGRDPVLDDLVPRLGVVDDKALDLAGLDDASSKAIERLHQAGLGLRFTFEAVVQDELSGLFDGETSKDMDEDALLTSFDVSQLPEDGPAVPMVVAAANTWLMGMLHHRRKNSGRAMRTTFLAEEGWHLVQGPGARMLRSNQKLSRALGLSNVTTMHHVGDVPKDSVGMSLLREAQTIHIYRQERADDIAACIQMYGLGAGAEQTLPNLDQGEHLLKIGNRTEIRVEHLRSDLETELTDTNEAMTAGDLKSLERMIA